jgi:hypothetical protein
MLHASNGGAAVSPLADQQLPLGLLAGSRVLHRGGRFEHGAREPRGGVDPQPQHVDPCAASLLRCTVDSESRKDANFGSNFSAASGSPCSICDKIRVTSDMGPRAVKNAKDGQRHYANSRNGKCRAPRGIG